MKISSFKGKNIYIFGGSSGIGLAAAEQLAGMGANIFIYARNKNRLQAATVQIENKQLAGTQKVFNMPVDISDPQEVKKVINISAEKCGGPDILINCAGRAYPDYFESITYEQFEETMKINLFGIWNTISAILPHMKKKGGVIVNTSSVAGYIGVFGYSDYAASKFGILGLSEALRSEFKKYNINVSVLCPPDTRTAGFEVENQTKPEETKAISKNAGILEADQVAKELIKGITKNKKMIIPGFDAKLSYYLKRWFPWLVEFVMDRAVLKTQKKQAK